MHGAATMLFPTRPVRQTASVTAWLERLGRPTSGDVVAGASVGLVLLPQSMAYAELAGLPAYVGLFAAVLPPLLAPDVPAAWSPGQMPLAQSALLGRVGFRPGRSTPVTADLTDRVAAGDVVAELAPMVGGGGGGRRDFAQAGRRQPENLEATLAAAPEVVGRLAGR